MEHHLVTLPDMDRSADSLVTFLHDCRFHNITKIDTVDEILNRQVVQKSNPISKDSLPLQYRVFILVGYSSR